MSHKEDETHTVRFRVVEFTPTWHPNERTTLLCRVNFCLPMQRAPIEVVDAAAYDELRRKLDALRGEKR